MVSDVYYHRMISPASSRCCGSYLRVGYPGDAGTCYIVDFDGDARGSSSKIGASESGLNTFCVSRVWCNTGDSRRGVGHQLVWYLGVGYAIISSNVNLEISTNSCW